MKNFIIILGALFLSTILFGNEEINLNSDEFNNLEISFLEDMQQKSSSLNTEYKICEDDMSIEDAQSEVTKSSGGFDMSWKCGFKPFPPFGCKVGSCVCDSTGNNCEWTFICN